MSSLKFNVEIKNIEQDNPLFSKCKIYICYSDLNRNNSNIPRKVIEDNLYTLYNCPIVGEYSKVKKDFLDHGGKVEVDNSGNIEYVPTTMPFGLVPESSEVQWESIDGKDYLTCTGYLWTDRFPEILDVIHEGRPQSMEISNVDGAFTNEGQLLINSFSFSGLCILGKEVEPCFESARVMSYSMSDFKDSFEKLKFEFHRALDNSVPSTEPVNNKQKFENKKENEVMSKTKADIATNFALTTNQLYEEIGRLLGQNTFEGENWWGEKCEMTRYFLRDFDENYIYAVDKQNEYMDVKLPYAKENDDIVIDFDSATRIKYVPTDWEGAEQESTEDTLEYSYLIAAINEVKDSAMKKFETYDKELADHEETVLNAAKKVKETASKFEAQVKELEEKQKQIEKLTTEVASFNKKDDQEKVDGLMKDFTTLLTEDEKVQLYEQRDKFNTFEDFSVYAKSVVYDKMKVRFKQDDKGFISMALTEQPSASGTSEPDNVWDRLKKNTDNK